MAHSSPPSAPPGSSLPSMTSPTTPPTSVSNSSLERQTKRRRIQDSSVAGSDVTVTSNVSATSFTLERYRVGVPALHLLPLISTDPPEQLPAAVKVRELTPRINNILRNQGVVFNEQKTSLVYRHLLEDSPSTDDLTVLVASNWRRQEDGDVWLRAADEIRTLLINSSSLTRNIKVELWSWHLYTARIVETIDPRHPIVAAWPQVLHRIRTFLRASSALNKGWRSIEVLRIGYDKEDHSPRPTTISITVDWGLDRQDWQAEERQIKDYLLDSHIKDVEVDFERGDVHAAAFTRHNATRSARSVHEYIKEDYPRQVSLGSDFGPQKDFQKGPGGEIINGPSGTIGAYIDIVLSDGTVKKLGVTNYHCVREALSGWNYVNGPDDQAVEGPVPKNSELDKANRNGILPSAPGRQAIFFESPSRRKDKFSRQYHDGRIQAHQSNTGGNAQNRLQRIQREEAAKQRKMQYFDQGHHKIGCLFACSGFRERTSLNGRIDIALLDILPGKLGDNTVPDAGLWSGQFSAPTDACGIRLQGIRSCDEREHLGIVYKVGSATGGTTGRFNEISTTCRMHWDKHVDMEDNVSTEYCFVADPQPNEPFTDHGDSGSFVFTEDGEWVGVVWGGRYLGNAHKTPLSYVMNAQAVLDWVSKIRDPSGKRVTPRLSVA